jgi:hypothetical protein
MEARKEPRVRVLDRRAELSGPVSDCGPHALNTQVASHCYQLGILAEDVVSPKLALFQVSASIFCKAL